MQIMLGQTYTVKATTNMFLINGRPALAAVGSAIRQAQDKLSKYAFEQGIVNKSIVAPIDQKMALRNFAGWVHLYLFRDHHLAELYPLKNLDGINFLRDTAMGKTPWLQTSGEKAAAWFLLFDYGKYATSLTGNEYTADQAGEDRFVNEAKVVYDQLKAIYDLRDSDPKAFSTYPDKMTEFLLSSKLADRVGAMYFMLKDATTDPVFAFPPPEAVFIQEGLVGVIRETPKAITESVDEIPTNPAPLVDVDAIINRPPLPNALPRKKSNTVLYVGVGVAALAAIGLTVWAIRRK